MPTTSVLGRMLLGSAILANGDSVTLPGITESATSALSLGQSVTIQRELNISVTSGMTLGQSQGTASDLTESAVNQLDLVQLAEQNIKSFDIISTVEFQQLLMDNTIAGIATNAIVFGQSTSTAFGTTQVAVASNLVLDQLATHNIKQVSVANALTLTQSAYAPSNVVLLVDSNLVLGQTAAHNFKLADAASALTLGNIAIAQLPISITVSSGLVLNQSTGTNIKDASASSAVVFGQSAVGGLPVSKFITSVLTFGQSVGVRQAVINASVGNILSFGHTAARTQDVFASNILSLNQSLVRTFDEEVGSELSLQGLVSEDVNTPFSQSIVLGQSAVANMERIRVITSAIVISQSVFPVLIKPGAECQYRPILTAGSTMPASLPTLVSQDYSTLTYPFSSPTFTVQLRTPKYGNQQKLSASWVRNRSRSGDLIGYFDPDWPKTELISVSFEGLSEDQATDLLAMLHESLGQEVGFLDHEGRQWRGIITTPTNEIIQSGRDCQYNGSFELQGVIV